MEHGGGPTVAMRIQLSRLLGWSVAVALAAGGLGALPMWQWAGPGGLMAELVAGAIGIVGVAIGGWVIARAAASGAPVAVSAFLPAEVCRLCVSVVLSAGAWAGLRLPLMPLAVWTLGFFLTMLLCEVAWLVGALRRHARLRG